MPSASVSEIHRYPLHPAGFAEPLFTTEASRKEVAEHLLAAPWLSRASELRRRAGESVHVLVEPIRLERPGGQAEVVRLCPRRRLSWERRRVVEVLDRWRKVRCWWDGDNHVDRLLFRVLLSGDIVVDLALERSIGWMLVGVVD